MNENRKQKNTFNALEILEIGMYDYKNDSILKK